MAADLVAAFFGARGQGKSTQVRHLIWSRAPARLLVFDPMDEYAGLADKVRDLADMGRRSLAKEFRLRYVAPVGELDKLPARFAALCTMAYARGDLLLVVEELQMVTTPSWAPPAWSECTLRGRHRGLSIAGVSQRPASVDKNFFSCCSVVSTCRLNFADDVQCLARLLGRPAAQVGGLLPYQYLARDMATGTVREGNTGELLRAMKGSQAARSGRRSSAKVK